MKIVSPSALMAGEENTQPPVANDHFWTPGDAEAEPTTISNERTNNQRPPENEV